uniref:Phosphoserine phosphatase n=1 Tax=Pongo abelii TaxID=9601 RepID=H2PP41_PONAB
MVSRSELRKLFPSADAVCFDVDSTVIREEGTDELAQMCGIEDAASEIPEAVRHVNLKDIGTGWPDYWVSLPGHSEPWVGQCLSKLLSRSA